MDEVTLLIDGDIVCYEAASAVEQETDWGDDLWTLHSDLAEAKAMVMAKLLGWQGRYSANLVIAFSDSLNFRKGVYPEYKSNRKSKRKPLAYKALKRWIEGEFITYQRPSLEGDDVLGILATHPTVIKGRKIIVSIDKDMKTIPGYVWNTDKDDQPRFYDEHEANYWHMFQTLTGDTTDGYPGCPGMGPVKAEKLLNECPGTDWWLAIVDAYAKKGLTEADALVQARCARILRYTDYDLKKKEVKLWSPTD